ncbi:type 4a pilus biogenesis protein PilO [candidate division WWE3 bacterium]|jgi:Tfp pilus assembly protein PilO|nr:type 4a pilus biogenesis protein PilO [candidate division WWE3 bacterium]MBT7349214.1 type 4a pilus biogenesis protein PilO [candidate division WWE3 bacterium]
MEVPQGQLSEIPLTTPTAPVAGEQPSKIKDTLLNFIVPIVALGLTAALFFVIIYPTMKKLPILREELQAKSTLENQLRTKLANLNKLLDFETVVEENASVLERVLVSNATVPELLTQVDIIAKNSGLSVNKLSYSFGEATEADALLSYSVVNISLGAVGNYSQVETFLTNLENSARLVDVSTYRFAAENSEDTVGLFNVTFILSSPYLTVESTAVTDDPVNVDISDPEFIELLDKVKKFRFFDISVDTQFEDLEESTQEELEGTLEEGEEVLQTEGLTDEEIQALISESDAIEEELADEPVVEEEVTTE